MFSCRSYKTQAELEELALVPTQMISPKDSSPIIGIVQDALLGAWMITRDDMFINKFDMMNILMHYEEFLGKLPKPAKVENGLEYWTGKQLMSQILPDINYKNAGVVISRGDLTQGRFNKRIIGSGKTGNLIHVAWKDHGIWMARDLINNIQRIANNYLLIQGHTMGIGDIVTRNKDTQSKINDTLLEGYLKVYQKQKDIDEGVAVVSIGKTQEEQFENDANEIMNAAQGDAGMVAKTELDPMTNNLYQMAEGSQSKGGPLNVMQMMACVGQQNVMNERVPKKYGDRSLPHFQRFDDSPDARGFCKHSYMQGLNPIEFFFHAMSGRVGNIDTAIKTAQSGYIARQLIKGHEDILVTQNMSVRNAMGNVIQWRYGDTGITITEIERLPLKFFKESKKTLHDIYVWSDKGLQDDVGKRIYTQEISDTKIGPMTKQLIENELTKLMNFYHLLHTRFFKYQTDDIIVYAPVNIDRTITNYKMQYNKSDKIVEHDLSPKYIINEVDILCAELPKMFHFHQHSEFVTAEREKRNKKVDKFDAKKYNDSLIHFNHDQNAVLLFEIYLRSILSSKRLISEFKISKFIFDKVLERIRVAFNKVISNPGDMIGPQGSQSIAEPVNSSGCGFVRNCKSVHCTGKMFKLRESP
jgi:DNA-directed RNA polymerase II subunit RPB1